MPRCTGGPLGEPQGPAEAAPRPWTAARLGRGLPVGCVADSCSARPPDCPSAIWQAASLRYGSKV